MFAKFASVLLACLVAVPVFGQDKAPPKVVSEVEKYLAEQNPKVKRGTQTYYAVGSLDQALKAFQEGNYGIGSVVLVKWDGKISEFRDRNAMVTGYGLRDHAEARALDRAVVLLATLKGRKITEAERVRAGGVTKADETYDADTPYLKGLDDGLHVFGTLEPCPMCMVMMINSGVKSSVSLAKDGEMKMVKGKVISDGAAFATKDKFEYAPQVWQFIREGQGLEFKVYEGDKQLPDLGLRIFLETREKIDRDLSKQK